MTTIDTKSLRESMANSPAGAFGVMREDLTHLLDAYDRVGELGARQDLEDRQHKELVDALNAIRKLCASGVTYHKDMPLETVSIVKEKLAEVTRERDELESKKLDYLFGLSEFVARKEGYEKREAESLARVAELDKESQEHLVSIITAVERQKLLIKERDAANARAERLAVAIRDYRSAIAYLKYKGHDMCGVVLDRLASYDDLLAAESAPKVDA